jgi:hypothetical protein
MPVGGREFGLTRAQALLADLMVNGGVEPVVTQLISGLGRAFESSDNET